MFGPSFGRWLKALHVLLLLPLLLARMWPTQPRVDGTLLYGALALFSAWWPVEQKCHTNRTKLIISQSKFLNVIAT